MRQMIADGIKVQCVVTSPPYFGLRNYNVDGQIGLEATPAEYIETMVGVFQLVRELLADDGTVWLNMGDSYASGGRGGCMAGLDGEKQRSNAGALLGPKKAPAGYKPKDLLGIPWRVAFALQADGWYLRQDIIWAKPNPMPESVTDRCTKAHEYVFLLTKKPNYFYDAEAVREPQTGNSHDRGYGDSPKGQLAEKRNRANSSFHIATSVYTDVPGGRNKRSVWTIPSQAYPDAHFATFPEALVEPCILAGTSQRGHCPECGKKWVRVVERAPAEVMSERSEYGYGAGRNDGGRSQLIGATAITLGWQPSCACSAEPIPDIVFDPFMGSGTVARVAQRLGRRWLGCELSGDYVKLQNDRTRQQGMALA